MTERVFSRLIEREAPLALAQRRWKAAARGSGHLLLVSGESGIGKTRLLAEFAATVPDTRLIRAAAHPRETDAAGAVLLELADRLERAGVGRRAGPADGDASDRAATKRAAADASDRPATARAAGPAPGREAGDVPDRIRARLGSDLDAASSPAGRRSLVRDLATLVLAATGDGDTVLAIEDLHWADDLSLEVLERVAELLPDAPTMVIATFRSDHLYPGSSLARWRARLLSQRLGEELRLARLGPEGTAALVAALSGEQPSSELAASIHRRSDGIPLHIEELVAAASTSAVPDTVAEAVGDRFADLDQPTRAVATAASVIGRAFSLDLLVDVTGAPVDELDDALVRLAQRQLVIPGEEGEFVFRHALLCDVVYGSMPPLRRRELHRAVAHAAEAAGLPGAYVSEHFEHAGEAEAAHRTALAAAEAAVRVSAHREAAALYARAERTLAPDASGRPAVLAALAVELAAIDANAEAAERFETAIALYRAAGDEASATALVPRLVAARHLLGDPLEARTALLHEALERSGDDVLLLSALAAAYMLDRRLDEALDYGQRASALATEPGTRVDIDATVGSVLVFAGRGDEGWPTLERAVATGLANGLEPETARAYRMLGSCASVLGEPRAAAWIGEGIDYCERVERWNDRHYLLSHLANVRWAEGDWLQAQLIAERAIADGRGGITTEITARIVLGYVGLVREDGSARAQLQRALELAEGMHELQRVSPALWGLAELELHGGDPAAAVALCERGFAASDAVMDAAYLWPFVLTGTRAHLALHDPGAARDWIERCRTPLQRRALPASLPALDHAAGLLALADGRTGAAWDLIEGCRHGWGRRWESDFARIDLARCAVRTRRAGFAAGLVQGLPAGLFERLAAQLSITEEASPLTSREWEVARLIAAGATNRQIAETLVISPKTASTHVEHILAKLGVSRRAEVAAWVTAAAARR